MTPASESGGPAPDPRETRQHNLVLFLQVALVAILVTSTGAVLLRGDLGRALAKITVAGLIAIPLIRVIWLGIRWAFKRDYRFAATAALLAIIVIAAELVGVF